MELQRREALQKKLAEEAERKKRKKRKINLWLNQTSCLFYLILQLSWVMRNCAYTVCTLFPHQINCLSRDFASTLIISEKKDKFIIVRFNGGHFIVVLPIYDLLTVVWHVSLSWFRFFEVPSYAIFCTMFIERVFQLSCASLNILRDYCPHTKRKTVLRLVVKTM